MDCGLGNELLLVEKPGRYAGLETIRSEKNWNRADVRWVLVFPDVYEVGLSHLGLRILYRILNSCEGVVADRAYTPWPDREDWLRSNGVPLCSIEFARPLKQFNFLGFSLQYELSYTSVLTVLDLSGVPFFAKDRTEEDPFVVAGGPCTFHAEPVADFFDFMVLGDGEEVILDVVSAYREWKRKGGTDRFGFLEIIRHIEGIYVPSFFEPHYSSNGKFIGIKALYDDYTSVSKRIIRSLNAFPYTAAIDEIVPVLEIVHDRLSIEIARGCTRGCRFCQAGFIYRPVRERHPEQVLEALRQGVLKTGYEEVSLLSLSTGDYSQINSLLPLAMKELAPHRVAVSLPSLRVGTLSHEMIKAIRSVRKTGFTLAPEAGSERLRRVINKNISTSDLMETARYAYEAGWKLLKLYFMIGLPTETDEDLDAIVSLCSELWKLGKKVQGRLNVSVSTFVPKPHTPFQWCGQISRDEVERKLDYLKGRLRRFRGVKVKWHHPGQSLWEAVLSRGDRRLARVVLKAWKKGARLDGWTELFKEEVWKEAIREEGMDPHALATRIYDLGDPLPWDHLSSGVSKKYLIREYEKAKMEEYTEDCRWGHCTGCGVCDLEKVSPEVWQSLEYPETVIVDSAKSANCSATTQLYWYTFVYRKLGRARFYSQTDIQRVFSRALRRTSVPVAYSQGFHPLPRISFDDALPVGMESLCERGWVALVEPVEASEFVEKWNRTIPEELRIVEMIAYVGKPVKAPPQWIVYRIEGIKRNEVLCLMDAFKNRERWNIILKRKKGIKEVSADRVIMEIIQVDDDIVDVTVRGGDAPVVRPADILSSIGLSPEEIAQMSIVKISAPL